MSDLIPMLYIDVMDIGKIHNIILSNFVFASPLSQGTFPATSKRMSHVWCVVTRQQVTTTAALPARAVRYTHTHTHDPTPEF